ncbi:hypothetical protein J6O48_06460 [bacterium]|nr:hypothetical protein [bacterium]
MLQVFSNQTSKIVLENQNPQKNIDIINEHIKLSNCENMTIDITNLNIMDACMISTICSTEHYMKYPNGNINWLTNAKEVEEYTSSFKLGNSHFLSK